MNLLLESKPDPKKAIPLFIFFANHPKGYVLFMIQVLEQTDENWCWVENSCGQTGSCPINHLRLENSPQPQLFMTQGNAFISFMNKKRL